MLNENIFYYGVIKKTIISFGRLFSNIRIERRENDSVNGTIVQNLHIPISYAPKEKWVTRIDSAPNLENNTYVSLPRMSYEISSISYDSTRKMSKMQKIICNSETSQKSMYSPVPYDIAITLNILTKTQEDGLQIIEQILPTFTPEYNMSIMIVPDFNVVQNIPIVLNGVSMTDEYDGDFQTRRFVTYNLNFNLKVNLFGPSLDNKIILKTETNVRNINTEFIQNTHHSEGNAETFDVVLDEWTNN
jgi:hypothetical protein